MSQGRCLQTRISSIRTRLRREKGLTYSTDKEGAYAAIVLGAWGFIPVFRWTTRDEALEQLKRIHATIGKVHTDVSERRRPIIAAWLKKHTDENGKRIPYSKIAQAVWGRTRGIRRPTLSQAIKSLPFEKETELFRRYQDQGKSYKDTETLVARRVRRSEAPAAAMVRQALRRGAIRSVPFDRAEPAHALGAAVIFAALHCPTEACTWLLQAFHQLIQPPR
jgi:hypothetical protein